MLLYQDALVRQRRWLTDDEFYEIVTVAQVLPGPNLVNLSAYLSNRLFGGPWVAVLGVLALALPGALFGVSLVALIDTSDKGIARLFQGFSFGSIVLFLVFLGRMVRVLRKDSAGSYRAWARPLLACGVAGASIAGVPLLPLLGIAIVIALVLEFAWG